MEEVRLIGDGASMDDQALTLALLTELERVREMEHGIEDAARRLSDLREAYRKTAEDADLLLTEMRRRGLIDINQNTTDEDPK